MSEVDTSAMPRITRDTPLKFTAPGGFAYAGRGRWHLPQGGQPGKWMRDYKTAPVLCERGYHWCEARHATLHLHAECYLIEPRGVTVRGDNKCVSQGGRLLRRVETWNERAARLFAADCAEAVVHLCGDDPRPREAVEVARRFARGEATADELRAAGDAARDAWAATIDAAWAARAATIDAAWAARAAARDAAWAAAKSASLTVGAAWAAAEAAAKAVGAAAEAAAWAARAAARDAAYGAQTTILLEYLNGERA